MRRSTVVLDDGFKPVKALARRKVNERIVALACSASGQQVVALTQTQLHFFIDRRPAGMVERSGNKGVVMTADGTRVILISFDGLQCYDPWGHPCWQTEYRSDNDIHTVDVTRHGGRLLVADGDRLVMLNRDGRTLWCKPTDDFVGGVMLGRNGRCYAGMEKALHSLDAEGNTLWSHRTGKLVHGIAEGEQHVLLTSGRHLICLSRDGNLLWDREVGIHRGLRLSEEGDVVLVVTDTDVRRYDLTGEMQWSHHENEFIEGVAMSPTGDLTLLAAGGEIFGSYRLLCLDRRGEMVWNHRSRNEISQVVLPPHGGEVVAGIGQKVWWFQNLGYLRHHVAQTQEEAYELLERVKSYESDLAGLRDTIAGAAATAESGKLDNLKEAYTRLSSARRRLERLRLRHTEYLDHLPRFLKGLGLVTTLPEELLPAIYPLYSLHSDLSEPGPLAEASDDIRERIKRLNSIRDTFGQQEQPSRHVQEQLHFTELALKELRREQRGLRELSQRRQALTQEVAERVRTVVMDWMTTGRSSHRTADFVHAQREAEHGIEAEVAALRERIVGHLAFVGLDDELDHVALEALKLRAEGEQVLLDGVLVNHCDETLEQATVRLHLEGDGLALAGSEASVLGPLTPESRKSFQFIFTPRKMVDTELVLMAHYYDATGHECKAPLERRRCTLPDCWMKPLEISESEHTELRTCYRKNHAQLTLTLTGLDSARAAEIIEGLPGLHLVDAQRNTGHTIFYLAGESNLKRVTYLTMVILTSTEQQLETEVLCYASTRTGAEALLKALTNRLRTRFMEAGGRLA